MSNQVRKPSVPVQRQWVATIAAIVREHGQINKEQILRRLPPVEPYYGLLRARVLFECRDIVSGPPRVGGFKLREGRRVGRRVEEPPAVYEIDLSAGLSPEQLRAAERLCELFSHAELEELVGRKLINAHRSIAKAQGGARPHLGKSALAGIVVSRFGEDLLAQPELRRRIAAKAGLPHVGRWHPGKGAAIAFTAGVGLPELFAGTPSERSAEDVEWLRGHLALPPLADFQHEVLVNAAEQLERARRPRTIITLPTGAGKTRTAVEYVAKLFKEQLHNRPCTALWIAHTAELLDQAIESFRQVWTHSAGVPELRMERRFGSHGRGDDIDSELLAAPHVEHQLVVATPQRMLNDVARWRERQAGRLESWLAAVELIVIDEAHRAAAPQYQALIGLFEQGGEGGGEEPRILGLTATPFRNEYMRDYPELGTKELYKLFRQIAAPSTTLGSDPRVTLQERQVLARPIEERVETGQTLSVGQLLLDGDGGQLETIEAIDKHLAELADDSQRRAFVFDRLLPVASNADNRILYFGPTVDDAEIVAVLLRAQGVPAGFVSGTTRAPQRRRAIEEFKTGSLRVLCNCEVLTTGFDAPKVSHVVIARPTVSHVLFEQMVGRGLRGPQFGGTETCHVLYFVDDLDVATVRLGYRAWRRVWGLDT